MSIADTTTNEGTLNIEDNYIGGNFILTSQSSDPLSATYVDNCIFKGNATINYLSQGGFDLGLSANSHFYKDVNFNLDTVGDVTLYGAIFNGSHDGTIRQTGNMSINFRDLMTVNKTAGAKVILDDSVGINGEVTFVDGNIQSTVGKPLIFRSGSDYTGASDSSKVVGPLAEIGHNPFKFPVGSEARYVPISVSSSDFSMSDRFTANYINHNPNIDGYNRGNTAAPLETINAAGYFMLNRDYGNSYVKVKVGYDLPAGIITNTSALRVARWNGHLWENEGNGGVTGNNQRGMVAIGSTTNHFGPFVVASVDSNANHLSIQQMAQQHPAQIILYPNPATNVLYIERLPKNSWFAVYDATGHKLLQRQVEGKNEQISLSQLVDGVYYILIRKVDGTRLAVKFIKTK